MIVSQNWNGNYDKCYMLDYGSHKYLNIVCSIKLSANPAFLMASFTLSFTKKGRDVSLNEFKDFRISSRVPDFDEFVVLKYQA